MGTFVYMSIFHVIELRVLKCLYINTAAFWKHNLLGYRCQVYWLTIETKPSREFKFVVVKLALYKYM